MLTWSIRAETMACCRSRLIDSQERPSSSPLPTSPTSAVEWVTWASCRCLVEPLLDGFASGHPLRHLDPPLRVGVREFIELLGRIGHSLAQFVGSGIGAGASVHGVGQLGCVESVQHEVGHQPLHRLRHHGEFPATAVVRAGAAFVPPGLATRR